MRVTASFTHLAWAACDLFTLGGIFEFRNCETLACVVWTIASDHALSELVAIRTASKFLGQEISFYSPPPSPTPPGSYCLACICFIVCLGVFCPSPLHGLQLMLAYGHYSWTFPQLFDTLYLQV